MKQISFIYFLSLLLIACTSPKVQQSEPMLELTGAYESKQGVMVPLSCYCGISGYLTTSNEKGIAVCFEGNNNPIDCKNITVTGFYKTVKNNPEPTSPCKQGEIRYFKVVKFKCL